MDRSEASALADLQMHWDEAYVIALDGHIWSARYRTSADELRAHTSSELRELIRSDYAYRQKADLIAYDPDEDYEDGGDGPPDDDEAAARDGETDSADTAAAEPDGTGAAEPDGAGAAEPDGAGGQPGGADVDPRVREVGKFAAIRGERMSI